MRVSFYQDNIYEVIDSEGESLFQGTLPECDAWINLREKGMI